MTKTSKILFSSIASIIVGGGIYLSSLAGAWIAPLEENIPQTVDTPTYKSEIESISKTPTKSKKTRTRKGNEWSDGDDWLSRTAANKYPSWKEELPELIEDAELLKKSDPVFYRYLYDNPFNREVELKEAKEKLDVLMDHTLMLAYSAGCPIGTAWILDYVLPENGKSYPTKFFIASNGHVVNAFKWDSKNPYHQTLSDPEKDLGEGWKENDCAKKPEEIMLIKEKINHDDSDFNSENWSRSQEQYKGKEMWVLNESLDVSKYKDKDNANTSHWQFKFKDPKLVYFPHNYLGEESKKQLESSLQNKYSVADFAVFEVDFGDETVAKLFTRNFYGKYNRDNGTHKEKALNFFADPLHKKYTGKQLLEEDIQVWVAGYPENGMSHKTSSNYNLNRKSASRFTYDGSFEDEQGHLLLGYYDHGYEWKWAGESYKLGGLYSYDNYELSAGSSGSLAIEDNGDVLGLHSGSSALYGLATPLRNIELKDKNGKIIAPKYDFIEGVKGQNGSYKEQIQKYFLSKGQQTGLSKLRKWEVPSQVKKQD